MDIPSLPNTMTPILSLGIHGWIPVRIIEYDRISPRQVDSNPTRPRREDKDKDPPIRIEPFHEELTLVNFR
jgi:hypothetical protein